MWTDTNMKPKKGGPVRLDRGKMFNCPVNPTTEELKGGGEP